VGCEGVAHRVVELVEVAARILGPLREARVVEGALVIEPRLRLRVGHDMIPSPAK
jgi:hypothetical protein